MTEEAQPPGVERAADETPGQPAGQEPQHPQPSYTTPEPAAAWRPSQDSGAGPVAPTADAAPAGAPGPGTIAGYPVAAPPGAGSPGGALATYPGMPGTAGGAGPAGVPAPPRESLRAPSRVDAVPGTPFGLVHLEVAPVTSGPAVASLVTGVGSVLVAFTAGCLGLAGSSPQDWGGWVAGAFAVLAGLLGLAGVLLGELGRRQTSVTGRPLWPGRRRVTSGAAPGSTPPPVRYTGRGLAIAGMSCAGVGLALTVLALAVAVLLQVV